MAHRGLAKIYLNVGAVKAARAELATASMLAERSNVTDKERLWISLAEQQLEAIYAPPDQLAEAHAGYRQALDELIQLDPDDAHAWVLRGNAEEANAWGRGQRGGVGSIAYYESALQRNPDHFPAHHYLVHAYEWIWHYGKAAEHGERFASLAPDIPHAHHMYAHVLPRVGRWEEALRQLTIADRLHREYFAREGISPAEDWHFPHNLHLLGTVQQRMGAVNETDRLYKEMFDKPTYGPIAARRSRPWLEQLVLEGRFEEAIREARTLADGGPVAELVGAVMEGHALLRLGQIEAAREARGRADAAYEAALAGTAPGWRRPVVARMNAPIAELDGLIALWGDDPAAGEAELLAAADAITGKRSVDGWATGMFAIERLARAAEQAQRPKLASQLRERIVKIDPEYRAATAGP